MIATFARPSTRMRLPCHRVRYRQTQSRVSIIAAIISRTRAVAAEANYDGIRRWTVERCQCPLMLPTHRQIVANLLHPRGCENFVTREEAKCPSATL